jgi:hypothetical protein
VFMGKLKLVDALPCVSWCILRTAGRMTLKLAKTLSEDGFEAWTPIETRKIRVPRSNVRRDVQAPIMPSYVFVRSDRLLDLLVMERMPVKPRRGSGWGEPAHAEFTVMRFSGDIPLIADHDLGALRRLEQKRELDRIRMSKAAPLPKGVSVKVREGSHSSWSGMIGRVVRSNAKDTVINFTSTRLDVTIRTSLVTLDDVGGR